jgi:hypothetical protein
MVTPWLDAPARGQFQRLASDYLAHAQKRSRQGAG